MTTRRYRTILCDPPWEYPEGWPGWADRKKRTPLPYPSMSLDEIAALPLTALLVNEGYLFLWTTNRYLEETFRIIRGWGCIPKQILTWCKEPIGIGPGGMFSTTTEFLVIAQRINSGTNAHGKRTAGARFNTSWFVFPRGRHSEKPSGFIEMIEAVSLSPRLEMFARTKRDGWDAWGNEIQSDITLPALSLFPQDAAGIVHV